MASRQSLLKKIQSDDPNVRTEGWQSAGEVGAPALAPLARLVASGELEVGRAAKRGMWKIVRTAGDPACAPEKSKEVVVELLGLLAAGQPNKVGRELLWMLSEIAGDEAVDSIASLIKNMDLREDARLVLDRIPGDKSLAALKTAFAESTDDFKHNLAQSLRHRGVEVPGVPCRKLVPTKGTSVRPVES